MPRKSARIKIIEYMRRKVEDRREREYLERSPDYEPRHPDDK